MLTVEMVAGDTIEVEVAAKGAGQRINQNSPPKPIRQRSRLGRAKCGKHGADGAPLVFWGSGSVATRIRRCLAKQALSEPIDMADYPSWPIKPDRELP